MGEVREAVDRRLRRPVAVKILRADLAGQPRARRRFETEARAAARLAHPNVVTVFDSGEQDGIPFLVMERLPGRTLADELAAGRLSLERVRQVAGEILAALAVAHAAGIIHRDIKPGNVLLTEDGHVKVGDFGIAKTIDDLDQTQTTELVATPGYLAPERIAGDPASPRSDLYSVGVLLYEALSGRRPFEGDNALGLMRAIELGHAEPLTGLRPELPADVVAVVERAMSRDPRRRFASATDMTAALRPSEDPAATVAVDAAVDTSNDTANDAATIPIALPSHDGATRALKLPSAARGERRPAAPPARRRVLAIALGAALAGILVVGVVANHDSGRPPVAALTPTTTPSASPTPTTAKLPAALGDAIRKLEQTVAK